MDDTVRPHDHDTLTQPPVPVSFLSPIDVQSGQKVLQLLFDHRGCDILVRQSYQRSRVPLIPYKILEDVLQSTRQLLDQAPATGVEGYLGELSAKIFENSSHPLGSNQSTTVNEYISLFTGSKLRWEAVGNIFAVAGRSLMATADNDALFQGDRLPNRTSLLCQMAEGSDRCLSFCSPVSCANELLVSLQVNDVMLKTQQYGDSSMVAEPSSDSKKTQLTLTFRLPSMAATWRSGLHGLLCRSSPARRRKPE